MKPQVKNSIQKKESNRVTRYILNYSPVPLKERGIVIGETRLTTLGFADDIVLFSSSATELERTLHELSDASLEVGLKMNMSKTKVMTNEMPKTIKLHGESIQHVQECLYLGHVVSYQAWKSYSSMKDLFKGELSMTLKKLMDIMYSRRLDL
ncbi:hypothetical protein PYW07_004355 [Mythimna separata]|uniref:Reverse transcriptase domain-containing protein n=1 Tax=Mythimna separata TaxID=271217 RepID=A0AAD7YXK1_MYTSE|nr:hypothetical protein PYW07_004355 [Mythimna separata]